MIQVKGLEVRYGAVTALQDVSLQVDEGECVAVLGANGAGKTSLLRAISGFAPTAAGDIRFKDESIVGQRPENIVRSGMSHVPEGRGILGQLTVRENLELATAPWRRRGDSIDEDLERVHSLFPKLAERRDQRAISLSGGEAQMLAIGRGLMARPRVMLLDEPSLGLAPVIVTRVFDVLEEVAEQQLALLIVEQNAKQALRVADRVYVLSQGKVVMDGPAAEVRDDPKMAEAYFGV